jgi:hypothetical protein
MADASQRPNFTQVAQAVADSLRGSSDYQKGDLITQRQVRAALANVVAIGWDVPDRDRLIDRALAESSFLVRELSAPAGRKFMRKLAQHPGTFSRLDRLTTIEDGQATIHSLIQQKGGDDLITYLATTSGGKNLGKMMASTKGGVDLNKPTGRIYTEDDFITAIRQVYDRAP